MQNFSLNKIPMIYVKLIISARNCLLNICTEHHFNRIYQVDNAFLETSTQDNYKLSCLIILTSNGDLRYVGRNSIKKCIRF